MFARPQNMVDVPTKASKTLMLGFSLLRVATSNATSAAKTTSTCPQAGGIGSPQIYASAEQLAACGPRKNELSK